MHEGGGLEHRPPHHLPYFNALQEGAKGPGAGGLAIIPTLSVAATGDCGPASTGVGGCVPVRDHQIVGEKGGGSGMQKLCTKKCPQSIFPPVNCIFSHYEVWGGGSGGGGGGTW